MLKAATPISLKDKTQELESSDAKSMDDADADPDSHLDGGSEEEDDGGKGGRNKSRRELPAGAVATLKAWLLSPEHFTHPYPTPQDQAMLMQKTGIDKKQLKNWFTNARRRIWKPMLKKQLEQGKLAATGGGGGGVAVPGVVPGLMVSAMPGGMVGQSEQVAYQQSMQNQQPQPQPQQEYGNQPYAQQTMSQPVAPPPIAQVQVPQQQHIQYYDASNNAPGVMALSSSIGSLPQMGHSGSGQQLNKTDSHAVLMELFARDQDLVRQATESAGIKGKSSLHDSQNFQDQLSMPQSQLYMSSQHPMKTQSHKPLVSVPTLNSWPHFSSVSSLNNLGTMPGVKSITSMSGADLARQGPVNTMENLAQVKSVESMGKNDSYAFLEVFFGDRSSVALNTMAKDQKGVKREREEDNDVGLSLEDESPFTTNPKRDSSGMDGSSMGSDMNPNPFMTDKDRKDSTGTLKRAYDDALAARGLISVSRSCEKLTDLALPAKIQRTLSQEYIRQQQDQQQHTNSNQSSFGQYQYNSAPSQSDQGNQNQSKGSSTVSQQYPGQHPGQQQMKSGKPDKRSFSSGQGDSNTSVEVPSATKCALCHQTNVDTQLRPCGHMFHERCLKPSLQAPMGPPKCPVDHIPMQSALLAVPTDENAKPLPVAAPMRPQPASWNPLGSSNRAVSTESKR